MSAVPPVPAGQHTPPAGAVEAAVNPKAATHERSDTVTTNTPPPADATRFWRKKPVVIEAVQFTGQNEPAVTDFLGGPYATGHSWKLHTPYGGFITTLEGDMEFSPGDWIIKGVKGEFYPCKPDVFAATYEPVVAGRGAPGGTT